jgi:hypothetical protein
VLGEELGQPPPGLVDAGVGLALLAVEEVPREGGRVQVLPVVGVDHQVGEARGDVAGDRGIVVGEGDDVAVAGARPEAHGGLHLLGAVEHRARGLLREEIVLADDQRKLGARVEQILELGPEARGPGGRALALRALGLEAAAVEHRGLAAVGAPGA